MRELTVMDVEDILGVPRHMVIGMLARGMLQVDRKGREELVAWREWRILETDLLAFLRNPDAAKNTHLAAVQPIKGPTL